MKLIVLRNSDTTPSSNKSKQSQFTVYITTTTFEVLEWYQIKKQM